MPQSKKQHYVPRFYLKQFSPDEASINIWLVQHKKGNLLRKPRKPVLQKLLLR